MFREIDFYLLQLSPYRQQAPLTWPTAQELEAFKQLGFTHTVTARPLLNTEPQHYEILTGEEMWLAAQQLQVPKVPVYIREDLSDDDAKRLVRQTGQRDPGR